MSLNNLPLESIKESDLQSLRDNKVCENKIIEFKQSLPGNKDKGKKEFLADIASFANASGGDLVYGIKETSGEASEVEGIEIDDVDREISRLENIIRDGIAPRIPNVKIQPIKLQTSKKVIIIRIPRSWMTHMVNYQLKGSERFYSRNSNGKYPLDVNEIRSAFVLSETTLSRIRIFRRERLCDLTSGDSPVSLDDSPKIVLHLIPLYAFDSSITYDLSQLTKEEIDSSPINSNYWDYRFNFDGYLSYAGISESRSTTRSFLQIFRNGIFEAVYSKIATNTEKMRILREDLEIIILKSIQKYVQVQRELGIEPPIIISLSMLGVINYIIDYHLPELMEDRLITFMRIDRDVLMIPEVLAENFEFDPTKLMKPAFDAIWNASGWPRSMLHYDISGIWTGPNWSS